MEKISDPTAALTLCVSEGADERIIYFVGGGVRMLSSGERRGVGMADYLLEKGMLPVDVLHEVLEEVRRSNRSLREVLLDKKVMSLDDVTMLTNKLIRDELMDLVFWDDAEYAIYTDSPPKEIYNPARQPLAGTLDLVQLGNEVREWCDRWSGLSGRLHSDDALLVLTEEGERACKDPFASCHDLCERVEGGVTLRGLARAMRIEIPGVCDLVVQLLDKGLVTAERPECPSGAEALALEVEELEQALERVVGKRQVLERLVDRLVRLGRKEEASRHKVAIAEILLAEAQWLEAADLLQEALALHPTDLKTFERLIKIWVTNNLTRNATQFATRHASRLVEQGHSEAAAQLARQLAALTGDRKHAESLLTEAMQKSGRSGTAVEQFIALAEEKLRAGDRRKAADLLRQAAGLYPDDENLRHRLDEIDPEWEKRLAATAPGGAHRRRGRAARTANPRARKLRLLIGAICCVPLLGAVICYPQFRLWLSAKAESEGSIEREKISPAKFLEGLAGNQSTGIAPLIDGSPLEVSSVSDPNEWIEFLMEQSGGPLPDEETAPESQRRGATSGDRSGTATGGARRHTHAGDSERTQGTTAAGSTKRGSAEENATQLAGLDILDEFTVPSKDKDDEPAERPRSKDLTARKSRQIRLPIDELHYLVYRDGSDLELRRKDTDSSVWRAPGKPRTHWAIGFRGEVACRWSPGQRLQIYYPNGRSFKTLHWKIPTDTAALAVSQDTVLLRVGKRTRMYDFAGNPRAGAPLGEWRRALFAARGLVLVEEESERDGLAEIHVVDPDTLDDLSSFRGDPDFGWEAER